MHLIATSVNLHKFIYMPSKNSQMTNHGCRHIFGLWKNCISGQEVISHFCEKSCNSHKEAISRSLDYLLLGVCHIVCWVHGLRFGDPQNAKSNVCTLAKNRKSSMGFFPKFKLHSKCLFKNLKVQNGLVTLFKNQENIKLFRFHFELSADSL